MHSLYHQGLELKCGLKPGTNGSYYIQISMLLCNLDEVINISRTEVFYCFPNTWLDVWGIRWRLPLQPMPFVLFP